MTKRISFLLALIDKLKGEITFLESSSDRDQDLLTVMYENLWTLEFNLDKEVKSHEGHE